MLGHAQGERLDVAVINTAMIKGDWFRHKQVSHWFRHTQVKQWIFDMLNKTCLRQKAADIRLPQRGLVQHVLTTSLDLSSLDLSCLDMFSLPYLRGSPYHPASLTCLVLSSSYKTCLLPVCCTPRDVSLTSVACKPSVRCGIGQALGSGGIG